MMKYLLVLALVALAFGGRVDICNSIENGDFDSANSIEPWLVNSYLGGSDNCGRDNNQCELLQQNVVQQGGFLNNAGRISVGQSTSSACRTNPDTAVGMNVFQANIGMCRGNTLRVEVGVQDQSPSASTFRVPDIFSIVVGRDHFDLNGGDHTVVATYEFPIPTTQPYNTFRNSHLEGVWNGPAGDSCTPICPQGSCFAVGVRYARNDRVTPRVRGYIDNFVITDTVVPVITANDVTGKATSCGAETLVNFDVTATDNCCRAVNIEYSRDGGATWFTDAFASFVPGVHTVDVKATDDSGNESTDQFTVRVYEFEPTISCFPAAPEDTQSCWTAWTSNAILASANGACASATPIVYNPPLNTMFRTGVTLIEASFTQPNAVDGDYQLSCTTSVHFNLCCEANAAKRDMRSIPKKLGKF